MPITLVVWEPFGHREPSARRVPSKLELIIRYCILRTLYSYICELEVPANLDNILQTTSYIPSTKVYFIIAYLYVSLLGGVCACLVQVGCIRKVQVYDDGMFVLEVGRAAPTGEGSIHLHLFDRQDAQSLNDQLLAYVLDRSCIICILQYCIYLTKLTCSIVCIFISNDVHSVRSTSYFRVFCVCQSTRKFRQIRACQL